MWEMLGALLRPLHLRITGGGETAFPALLRALRELQQSFAMAAQENCRQEFFSIGAPEIRRYFRAAGAAFFNSRSLRILADW